MEFAVIEESSPAAVAAVERYFDELAARFEQGFDPASYRRSSAASGAGWFVVATLDGETVGCGALQPLAAGVAEIKRMWVDPTRRGHGIGRQLLAELERLAIEQGRSIVRLDTNAALTEAIAMYDRAGYRRIPRYNDNPYAQVWFEKTVVAGEPPEGGKSSGTNSRHSRTDV